MRVLLDIDGVLADFVFGYTKVLHWLGAPIVPYGTRAQKTWALPTQQGLDPWEPILDPEMNFHAHLPSLASEGEWAKLRALQDRGVTFYFVTARSPGLQRVTEGWLQRHGVKDPRVLCTKSKLHAAMDLGIEYSLEDNAGTAIALAALPIVESYLLDRGYNYFDHDMLIEPVNRIEQVDNFLDAVAAALPPEKT